jgi:hypothetical protein
MVVEIAKDECLCDEIDVKYYVDVLNGIVYECMHGGFSVGHRNEVAVDLAVASYMLGLDAVKVLDWLVKEGVINPCDDDEDTYRRVETMLDYKNRFDWEYMIDPTYYMEKARDHPIGVSKMPVSFHMS